MREWINRMLARALLLGAWVSQNFGVWIIIPQTMFGHFITLILNKKEKRRKQTIRIRFHFIFYFSPELLKIYKIRIKFTKYRRQVHNEKSGKCVTLESHLEFNTKNDSKRRRSALYIILLR